MLRAPLASFGAYWADQDGILPSKNWVDAHASFRFDSEKIVACGAFFQDRFSATFREGRQVGAREFHAARPGERLVVGLEQYALEELTLEGLRPEDLPAELRVPGHQTKGLAGPLNRVYTPFAFFESGR
mgnify:FL=1